MRVTPDNSQSDWVGDEGEHDRGFQAGPLEREDGRRRDGDNQVGLLRREACDERVEAIGISFPAQKFDRRHAAVVVAKLLQRLEQQVERRSLRVSAVQDGDPRALSCAHRRHGQSSQQPSDEHSAPHSITSLARGARSWDYKRNQ